MSQEACETCRFWKDDQNKYATGHCRCYAPKPNFFAVTQYDADGDGDFDAYWPLVSYDDWCGEYESKSDPSVFH
jgi:hypothetical protein